MENTFKIKTEEVEGEIIITVSCKKIKFASQKRFIFDTNLIKEAVLSQAKGKNIELVSEPTKQISNINKEKYSNIGVWRYKIVKNEKKDLTRLEKKAIINKENSKPTPRRRKSRTRVSKETE